MKLVAFEAADSDGRRLGFADGEQIIDGVAALGPDDERREWLSDAISFIAAGAPARKLAAELIEVAPAKARLSRSSVRLRAPILPSTILATGSNYRAHNAEKANNPIAGKEPSFFVMTSDCVVGPDEPIVLDPILTQKLDVETELGIVIGAPGRHIPIEEALNHVFGYTVINDVTARDRQVRRSPEGFIWYETGKSKAFDSSAPTGPCIVTTDEITDPQTLGIRTRVNGELRQSASTADMIFTCAEIVQFFSMNFTLKAGMVITTGTPAGTAWGMDKELGGSGEVPPGVMPSSRYCQPGDVVESEIDGIGVLRNPITAP